MMHLVETLTKSSSCTDSSGNQTVWPKTPQFSRDHRYTEHRILVHLYISLTHNLLYRKMALLVDDVDFIMLFW